MTQHCARWICWIIPARIPGSYCILRQGSLSFIGGSICSEKVMARIRWPASWRDCKRIVALIRETFVRCVDNACRSNDAGTLYIVLVHCVITENSQRGEQSNESSDHENNSLLWKRLA